ncbi:hypothetical protein C8R48DRAFT_730928 [Suillus tomentosus]|nr:hypothetical protein C8R48DRAFT_730928 [Suillus tomentosus]
MSWHSRVVAPVLTYWHQGGHPRFLYDRKTAIRVRLIRAARCLTCISSHYPLFWSI